MTPIAYHRTISWVFYANWVRFAKRRSETNSTVGSMHAIKTHDPVTPQSHKHSLVLVRDLNANKAERYGVSKAPAVCSIPSKTFSNARLVDSPEAGGPNGGYLAKLLLEAAIANCELTQLAPRVVGVQFISSPVFEAIGIETEILRRSSNSCFVSARIHQGDKVRVTGQVCYGRSERAPAHRPIKIPTILPPEACLEPELAESIWPHFSQHCEYKVADSPAAFSGASNPEMLCWIRMRDIPIEAASVLFLMDCMFPTFFLAATSFSQSLTTDLHVTFPDSFIRADCGAWVLLRTKLREWAGGCCIEETEAWLEDGRFLALGQQMRRVFVQDRKLYNVQHSQAKSQAITD